MILDPTVDRLSLRGQARVQFTLALVFASPNRWARYAPDGASADSLFEHTTEGGGYLYEHRLQAQQRSVILQAIGE